MLKLLGVNLIALHIYTNLSIFATPAPRPYHKTQELMPLLTIDQHCADSTDVLFFFGDKACMQ